MLIYWSWRSAEHRSAEHRTNGLVSFEYKIVSLVNVWSIANFLFCSFMVLLTDIPIERVCSWAEAAVFMGRHVTVQVDQKGGQDKTLWYPHM